MAPDQSASVAPAAPVGSGAAVQTTDQSAGNAQLAGAASSAKQVDPQRLVTDVGIDEFSLKKRHKLYVTILTDLTNPERPEVLAMAEGRDEAAGRKCLEKLSEEQRRQVQTYRADMGQAFHNACRGLLGNARAVVDRFQSKLVL